MNIERLFVQHSATIIIWLGVLCTLAIFSILYKENIFYRMFEHIFIGLATGQILFTTIRDILYPLWWKRMVNDGHWYWIFALLAGLMFYFVYSKKYAWISRIIFGAFMGLTAGQVFKGFATEYVPQMAACFKPLYIHPLNNANLLAMANNLVFLLVLVTCMAYFFFSIDHKHVTVRKVSGAGRWFLMFAFGALFGATVGARMSLLIGRIYALMMAFGWRQ